MGSGPSVSRPASAAARREDKMPPVHRRSPVPTMNGTDLANPADECNDAVTAPTRLPLIDVELTKRTRYDLTTPEMGNAPTRSSAPSLPPALPNASSSSKGYGAQTSLSTSTQRQYGLSDNTSQRSSSASDDEWNPREFGPVMDSFHLPTHRKGNDPDSSFQNLWEEDEAVGFYLHFLQLNGAASGKTQRSVSAKELLGQASADNARMRFLMGGAAAAAAGTTMGSGEGPGRSPHRSHDAGEEKQRRSRYTAARELGPVDADAYLDALYLHSRERERTHFFIDPDGEIRRLYHTDGWHRLGSTKRRELVHRHRSGSADSTGSRRSRRSRKHQSSTHHHQSNGSSSSSSSSASMRPLSASHGLSPRNPATSTVPFTRNSPHHTNASGGGLPSPAEQLGGAASRIRNTRFGSSGMLSSMATGPQFTPTPPPAKGTEKVAAGGRSLAYSGPHKSSSPPEPQRVDTQTRPAPSSETLLTESTVSVSLGSGRASTLPRSRSSGAVGGGDFFSQAFGGGASGGNVAQNNGNTIAAEGSDGVAGLTPPSLAQSHISPILVKTEGDFPGSTSRRASFNTSRRDAEGTGEQLDSSTPRRRLSTRRVSFSQGTRYFKKDPFYLAPRSEESEFDDLTPPETTLSGPQRPQPPSVAVKTAAPESAPAALTPARPEISPSYAQLTLLKDKMTQNRERNMLLPK